MKQRGGAAVAIGVTAQQVLNVAGIVHDSLGIAVVAVDKHDKTSGGESNLRALVVAGGCAYPTLTVAIDRQTGYIDGAAPDAFVGLSLAAYAQRERIADKVGRIETADAVAIGDRSQIDEVNEGVNLIELLAL